MSDHKPNTRIEIRKNGRARVLVNGVAIVGVIGVELRNSFSERVVDECIVREKAGSPIWTIALHSRFVNCSPEEMAPASVQPDESDLDDVVFSEETPDGGRIVLVKYPEGYRLRYHGEVVWRQPK